jgi:hypothetical protein
MAESRVFTLVTNLTERRRIRWLPPNGRIMDHNESVSLPGVLETELVLGLDPDLFDIYEEEVDRGDVQIHKIGYYTEGGRYHIQIVGDGYSTVFDIDAGFLTASAGVFLYDRSRQTMIHFVDVVRSVPDANSIRVTLTPAPASGEVEVYIFE